MFTFGAAGGGSEIREMLSQRKFAFEKRENYTVDLQPNALLLYTL